MRTRYEHGTNDGLEQRQLTLRVDISDFNSKDLSCIDYDKSYSKPLPFLQVLSSLFNWLVLEGAVNEWIDKGVRHSEEENPRLEILAQSFVWFCEHEYQHHRVIPGKKTVP